MTHLNSQEDLDNALFIAVGNEDSEGVKEALRKGANVNAKNECGYTSLHYAAYLGHTEIAKLLLEADANINDTDKF